MDLTWPADAAAIELLADQIALQPGAPLHLPLPVDPLARVIASVAGLADGESVASVGIAMGYSSPSSFVAAFRAELGTSPRDFLRTQERIGRRSLHR